MNAPKVSVLTPIYNVARFLPQCLDSLLAQTLDDIEFICINDGSTDESLSILKDYASRDERIIIIDKANGGYGESMNRGLETARGTYIGIVESDDFVDPEAFERLYEVAAAHDLDIVRGNRYKHTQKGDTYQELLKGLPYDEVFRPLDVQKVFDPAPCIWSAIYRRDFLLREGIWFLETPGASFQDTGFVYKSYIAAERMMLLKDAFLHYRMDNAGSSVKSAGKVFCITDEFASIDAFLQKRPAQEREVRASYQALRFQAYKWNYNRLSWKAREAFLLRFAEEFRAIDARGELCRKEFALKDWHWLQRIMADDRKVFAAEAPLLSVIIPAYNCEAHLIDTLDSLMRQTFTDFEVFVIDDGSTDQTGTIADDYAKKHKRVTVVHQPNGGVSSARNAGLALASGTYLTFIDAEDTVPANAFEKMVRTMQVESADLVVGRVNEFNAIRSHEFVPTVRLSKKTVIEPYDFNFIWTFAVYNKLFLRSKVEELDLHFEPYVYGEDGIFLMQYLLTCKTIRGVNARVLNYRRNFFWGASSATRTPDKAHMVGLSNAFERIIETVTSNLENEIRTTPSDFRRQQLLYWQPTYLSDLHRKCAETLINSFYRFLWMLDEDTFAELRDTMNKLHAQINATGWEKICALFDSFPINPQLLSKEQLALQPIVTAVLAIDNHVDEQTIADHLNSLYRNYLPSFELLVPQSMRDALPQAYQDLSNIRYIATPNAGLGAFMNEALTQARGAHIVFLRDAVYFDAGSLIDAWKKLRNAPVDMVVSRICPIFGDKHIPWWSQEVIFSPQHPERFEGTNDVGYLDCGLNNKLMKTRALRRAGISFTDDWHANAALVYSRLSYERCPKLRMITRLEERAYFGDDAAELVRKTKLAHYRDVFEDEVSRRAVQPVQSRMQRYTNAVTRRLKPNHHDIVLFVASGTQPTTDLKLVYDRLDSNVKVMLAKPYKNDLAYDETLIQHMQRSKLILVDGDCPQLSKAGLDHAVTKVVRVGGASSAFKRLGLNDISNPITATKRLHSSYDLVIASSELVRPTLAHAFGIPEKRIAALGMPHTDLLLDPSWRERARSDVYARHTKLKGQRIVAYLPTCRMKSGTPQLWEPSIDWTALNAQLPDDVTLLVHEHPLERFDILAGRDYPHIQSGCDLDALALVSSADLVITDYSTVAFDAVLAEVPTLFYCPDLNTYKERCHLDIPRELPGALVTEAADLPDAITAALSSKARNDLEDFIGYHMGACDGAATDRLVAYLDEHYL